MSRWYSDNISSNNKITYNFFSLITLGVKIYFQKIFFDFFGKNRFFIFIFKYYKKLIFKRTLKLSLVGKIKERERENKKYFNFLSYMFGTNDQQKIKKGEKQILISFVWL